MGLDSFWVKQCAPGETARPVDLGREINLIGGMFSGNGADGSFRGKCYDWFVTGVGGPSLYEELLWNSGVQAAAQAMREWYDAHHEDDLTAALKEVDEENWDVFQTWKDVDDFIVMFERFGEEGYCLAGWW
jgi:hypothetical protein